MAQNMNAQLEKILEQAEKKGVTTNFYFKTTLERYLTLQDHMKELQDVIKKYGVTIDQQYATGRKSVVVNPAYAEYNKTVAAANQTATTLMNITSKASESDGGSGSESFDKVLAKLAGDLSDGQ